MTETIEDIIIKRYGRRKFLGQAAVIAAGIAVAPLLRAKAATSTALSSWAADNVTMADSFQYEVLLKWGEALKGAAIADITAITPEEQERAFGYNNDFTTFISLKGHDHGLLCVNHEYPLSKLMFPEGTDDERRAKVEMASVGHSVVEIKKDKNSWHMVKDSKYNRRITATTPCLLSGAAAGSDRLKTSSDQTGTKVIGTFQNCSGGVTPWHSVLSCEENIDSIFSGKLPESSPEQNNYRRMGIGLHNQYVHWAKFDKRFDMSQEPNEANRFGWVVEIDPHNPKSIPVKRTSLGRMKHECAACTTTKDGRVVIYMSDDEAGEHIYRYVSKNPYKAKEAASRNDVMDNGTLYSAVFNSDGSLSWLPLIHGTGKLTPENGFNNQADVMIETRHAASLLGATPMDRPEGIAINPLSHSIYVSLTMNKYQKAPNPANPREINKNGHIISFTPPDGDHGADKFTWSLFYVPEESDGLPTGNRLTNPDNLACSPDGYLWVATDGMEESANEQDGMFKLPTRDVAAKVAERILAAPVGSEVTGPSFSGDAKTMFLSIQHPGSGSSFANPSTRWPDFNPKIPCRPAVIAISRKDGKTL